MIEQPKLYISVERKVGLPGYSHRTFTLGISQLPYDASPTLIEQCMQTGENALHMVSRELEDRLRIAADPAAFDEIPPIADSESGKVNKQAQEAADVPGETGGKPLSESLAHRHVWRAPTWAERERHKDVIVPGRNLLICEGCGVSSFVDVDSSDEVESDARTIQEIPDEDDVKFHLDAFGVQVEIPPGEWRHIPITEICKDGKDGGQLKAVNAALTSIGHKGKDRHRAATQLLYAFSEPRDPIDSIRDLTKFEASLILEWIAKADNDSLILLSAAMNASRGRR